MTASSESVGASRPSSRPSGSPGPAGPASARSSQGAVRSALIRYRIIAYVVGVVLIALVCVAMPLKYLADTPGAVSAIGPFHGLLYMVYLALTLDLATRCRFPARRTILVMLAGTIPFLSFVAERKVANLVRAEMGGGTGPAPAA